MDVETRVAKNKRRMYGMEMDKEFVNGFLTGIGIGCLLTFFVLWLSIYFSSQFTAKVSYETMISVFIYPLLLFLVIGTITLTIGRTRHSA